MVTVNMNMASGVTARCRELRSKWATRARKMQDWYEVLELKNELEQKGMESVTSNDPRTGFNLGRHLLVTMIIAHKISSEELLAEEIPGASYLESFNTRRWQEHEHKYRAGGKQGWMWDLVSWLMASGWYAVFSMVEEGRIWSEVWSPADVFPNFGDGELIEVAHIYSLTALAANRKAKKMGWTLRQPFTGTTTLYDYWGFDSDGDVVNSIVLGTEFVKAPQKDPALTKVGRLPVFCSPAGGLPDMGSIKRGADWQNHFGESVVATNEDLTKNYNRMLSFIQQTARNAAQPRYLELSSGDTPIATDEQMNKWGPVFHGAPGESLTPIIPPAIPVELRQGMFDYQNMLQRGLFPSAVFGNIQQTMSYLAMANVASAALQILTPYQEAIKGLLTDIDNYWYAMIKENAFRPYKFEMPENLPDDLEFDVRADIEIPGYLIQRATVARMLDPEFQLQTTTVMERLFPEIKDAIREQAGVRKDRALMHPKAIMVDQIMAYRGQARLLEEAGDVDSARLYEKLADSLEAELVGPTTAPGRRGPGMAEQAIMREAFPTREATAPREGMGRV